MKRREFIALLGGAMAGPALPFSARAQQPIRPLIAVLSPLSPAAAARNVAALRAGLRDLGYAEGRNMSMEFRHAAGAVARLPALAAELIALNPDAIIAGSVQGILAAHGVTKTVPIVMSAVSIDPTTIGLARSIAKPGGNVTGFWLESEDSLIAKRLELLKDAVVGVSRVGLMINPVDATDSHGLLQLPASARALNLDVRILEVRSADQLEAAITGAAQDGLQGLCVSQAPLFNENRERIAELATRARLPTVHGFREFAVAGGLLSYAASLPDIYRRSAAVVDKIAKGTKPGDIPIERPGRFELVVNLKTAKALDIKIPERFLLIADEIIE
jgi:putative ABC transport system substrate-binding protein